MFKPNAIHNWLWNTPKNEFGTSDLRYFVGYQIASRYYDAAYDKQIAIKRLIEIDYDDETTVEELVDGTNYFSNTLKDINANFESKRPEVISISEFTNFSESVNPHLKVVTLNFSEPMNSQTRGFDFCPLGEDNVLRVQKVIGFSDDRKSFSFEVKIENKMVKSYFEVLCEVVIFVQR